MIPVVDSASVVAAKPEAPPPWTLSGSAAGGPTLTGVAAPPVEAREGARAFFGRGSGMSGRLDDGHGGSSSELANEESLGCGWKLVYESELEQVFLDLVERDSDTVVMRIPNEGLIRYLRSVADSGLSRQGSGGEAQLDLVA